MNREVITLEGKEGEEMQVRSEKFRERRSVKREETRRVVEACSCTKVRTYVAEKHEETVETFFFAVTVSPLLAPWATC